MAILTVTKISGVGALPTFGNKAVEAVQKEVAARALTPGGGNIVSNSALVQKFVDAGVITPSTSTEDTSASSAEALAIAQAEAVAALKKQQYIALGVGVLIGAVLVYVLKG